MQPALGWRAMAGQVWPLHTTVGRASMQEFCSPGPLGSNALVGSVFKDHMEALQIQIRAAGFWCRAGQTGRDLQPPAFPGCSQAQSKLLSFLAWAVTSLACLVAQMPCYMAHNSPFQVVAFVFGWQACWAGLRQTPFATSFTAISPNKHCHFATVLRTKCRY